MPSSPETSMSMGVKVVGVCSTGPRTLKVRRNIILFEDGLNNLIAPLTPGARPT